MRVTAILPRGIGDKRSRSIECYRIVYPYTELNKHTDHQFYWTPIENIHLLNKKQLGTMLDSDIIVLQRVTHKDNDVLLNACNLLRSKGAKLVFETDDDLSGIYRETGQPIMNYMRVVDAVTATTPILAERMAALGGDIPSHVLPNYLRVKWFEGVSYLTSAGRKRQREFPGTLNVMLIGTNTHGADWKVCYEAMKSILDDYPNVRLLFGGYIPEYVEEHERIFLVEPRPYTLYPEMMFEADIVLAGLDPDDKFNEAKSACKALEAWAAKRDIGSKTGGAALIATDHVVYNGTVTHGTDGLLVDHTVDSWDRAIRKLLDDEKLRHALQKNGLKTVRKRHRIENHYSEWLTAYTKILYGGK